MISVHFNCLSAFKFNRALLPITDLKLFAGITPFLGAGLLTETFKLFSISPFLMMFVVTTLSLAHLIISNSFFYEFFCFHFLLQIFHLPLGLVALTHAVQLMRHGLVPVLFCLK